jgi:hypothetical protein
MSNPLPLVTASLSPSQVTREALDNPEGLAKLAKTYGISMPPRDAYFFPGEKEGLSAEAAAKRLGVAKDDLQKLDGVSLSAKNVERVPDYRDAFFNAYPGLIPIADKIWVHHAVPKWVLKEYPGVFTAKEVNEVGSLRGIHASVNSDLHNRLMHNEWKRFLADHPKATRQQVLNQVQDLDSKYGHLFIPTEGVK